MEAKFTSSRRKNDPTAAILGCKIQPLQRRCRLIQRDINRRNPICAEEMSLAKFDECVENLTCAFPVVGLCQPIGEVRLGQRALVGLPDGQAEFRDRLLRSLQPLQNHARRRMADPQGRVHLHDMSQLRQCRFIVLRVVKSPAQHQPSVAGKRIHLTGSPQQADCVIMFSQYPQQLGVPTQGELAARVHCQRPQQIGLSRVAVGVNPKIETLAIATL